MTRLMGVALLIASVLLLLAAAATLVAMVLSLTVRSTLPAVESAFGSLVAALVLLGFGVKAFKAGRGRLMIEPRRK